MKQDVQGNAPAGAVYGVGLIGAAVYLEHLSPLIKPGILVNCFSLAAMNQK